jgi:hypothetical protein
MSKLLFTMLIAGVAPALEVSLHATVTPDVPEISPGSISAGLAVLAAGVLVVRARRRSK